MDRDIPMHYRTLGNSGAVVTTFSLGTMTFGASADEATSHAILGDYVESGGNLIDTADVYSKGASEEMGRSDSASGNAAIPRRHAGPRQLSLDPPMKYSRLGVCVSDPVFAAGA